MSPLDGASHLSSVFGPGSSPCLTVCEYRSRDWHRGTTREHSLLSSLSGLELERVQHAARGLSFCPTCPTGPYGRRGNDTGHDRPQPALRYKGLSRSLVGSQDSLSLPQAWRPLWPYPCSWPHLCQGLSSPEPKTFVTMQDRPDYVVSTLMTLSFPYAELVL